MDPGRQCTIHGRIASGGMASVHFGRVRGSEGFGRTVAIKRLHPHLAEDPAFRAMLVDEARMAGRIHHPHVVPTLDVVSGDGEIFVVMAYVHGESLARLMRFAERGDECQRALPLDVAVAIAAGALHGLHAAHLATSEQGAPLGIVHRDVSPQNLLVGIDGLARVIDFGIAKAAGRLQVTREGTLKGKRPYMAPEQIAGRAVSLRTDVYAFGVVLWEMRLAKTLRGRGGGWPDRSPRASRGRRRAKPPCPRPPGRARRARHEGARREPRRQVCVRARDGGGARERGDARDAERRGALGAGIDARGARGAERAACGDRARRRRLDRTARNGRRSRRRARDLNGAPRVSIVWLPAPGARVLRVPSLAARANARGSRYGGPLRLGAACMGNGESPPRRARWRQSCPPAPLPRRRSPIPPYRSRRRRNRSNGRPRRRPPPRGFPGPRRA